MLAGYLAACVDAHPDPIGTGAEVLGIDDFALRRRHTYATVVIDAATGRRVEVLPGRTSKAVAQWLHNQCWRLTVEGIHTYHVGEQESGSSHSPV